LLTFLGSLNSTPIVERPPIPLVHIPSNNTRAQKISGIQVLRALL